jgi:hypothetical protein
MSVLKRLGAVAAVVALVGSAVVLAPSSAKAWWAGGVRFGVVLPPVVVAPAPVYVPPPVAYYPPPPVYYAQPAPPPHAVWVPGHWQGGYWVPGHWA